MEPEHETDVICFLSEDWDDVFSFHVKTPNTARSGEFYKTNQPSRILEYVEDVDGTPFVTMEWSDGKRFAICISAVMKYYRELFLEWRELNSPGSHIPNVPDTEELPDEITQTEKASSSLMEPTTTRVENAVSDASGGSSKRRRSGERSSTSVGNTGAVNRGDLSRRCSLLPEDEPEPKIVRVNGKRYFECPEAGCTFKQKQKVNTIKHYTTIHLGLKIHRCTDCHESFGQVTTLNQHIRSVHRNEKPFVCDLCDYRGTQAANLALHKNKHHPR